MEDPGTGGRALGAARLASPFASTSPVPQVDFRAQRSEHAAPLAVAFAAIIVRDLRRTWRQRGRLLSALVRPLLWLVVIGGGVEGLIGRGGQAGYRGFLAPGLLAMALLFGGMFASLSLVLDKESGVLRMLLLAPFNHAWIVLARLLSSAAVGLLQATLLLAVLAACGYLGGCDVALLAVGLVATALAAAAMGMLLAVWVRSLENFSVMVNVVIFPLFFLSGALYPVQGLPPALRWAAQLNPFSYGVDLLKHATGSLVPPFAPDFSVAGDLAVLAGFTVAATALACWRFSSRGTIAALARLVAR
ncbi:MAG: ABC transporter permease [Planctomycetes bacterium]|nr:ABC transporter permease [Planctomycetota bacterium]